MKPKAKTRKIISYDEMISYIEKKYKFSVRDYHDFKFGGDASKFNAEHRIKWEDEHYPFIKEHRKNPLPGFCFNQKGKDFFDSRKGSEFSTKIWGQYSEAPDGKCLEIPYMDFWHFILDYLDEVHNPSIHIMNWAQIKEFANEDWQKEICDILIKEFGDKDLEVEIEW